MILSSTTDLSSTPKRIMSLVPSQTELLFDLGLETETIGITKFCVHPKQWFNSKQRVGGTKRVNIELINQLQPDLVIANKEENVKEQVEALAKDHDVWVTDVNNLDDALQMIKDIGELTQKEAKAAEIALGISQHFHELQTTNNKLQTPKLKTAYLIWRKPYMAAGGDTFINDMLLQCGLENIFHDEPRYPEASVSQLSSRNCQLLLLSSEPYPFKQKHVDELAEQLPDTHIMLVDGEMFSWYGSRLLKAPAYFQRLMNSIPK